MNRQTAKPPEGFRSLVFPVWRFRGLAVQLFLTAVARQASELIVF
jgi:hypothetical protein